MNPTTKRALMNHMQRRKDDYPPDISRDYPSDRYDDWDGGIYDRQRRNSRGRYMPTRNEYGEETRDSTMPYYPPIFRDNEKRTRRTERRDPMNRIGFAVDGEMERLPDHNGYKSDATYHDIDEMGYRSGRQAEYGGTEEYPKLTRDVAMEWADSLENADGTTGPHWPMVQIKNIMADRKLTGDPIDWFLAMNLTYSDLCKVFKKYNISNLDAYVDFAKAFWLADKDFPDKLEKYHAALEM